MIQRGWGRYWAGSRNPVGIDFEYRVEKPRPFLPAQHHRSEEEFLSRIGLGFGPIGCSDGSRTVDQVLVDSVRGAQVERIESKVLFAIALEADANLDVPVES